MMRKMMGDDRSCLSPCAWCGAPPYTTARCPVSGYCHLRAFVRLRMTRRRAPHPPWGTPPGWYVVRLVRRQPSLLRIAGWLVCRAGFGGGDWGLELTAAPYVLRSRRAAGWRERRLR